MAHLYGSLSTPGTLSLAAATLVLSEWRGRDTEKEKPGTTLCRRRRRWMACHGPRLRHYRRPDRGPILLRTFIAFNRTFLAS
ncbi:hypothetical protein E2C01_061354 [Portunus trituberculatus]|uniref:Uncharacterized protein n=1 Tax=Portunus trituberculatus TaxID=210409 RepID=A0A5B7HCY7_PORTR|nr:hypothetical protein [Portunus trituberculatus]